MAEAQPRYVTQPYCTAQFVPEHFTDYDQAAALAIAALLPELADGWERGNAPFPNSAFFTTGKIWLHLSVHNICAGYLWDVHAQLYWLNDPGFSRAWELRDLPAPERRQPAIEDAAVKVAAWLDEQIPAAIEQTRRRDHADKDGHGHPLR